MQSDDTIPPALQRIVLTGFMGAGKSTTGPILAERLRWQFIDADHYLQHKTGTSIANLFLTHGEPRFRQMEAEAFAELFRRRKVVVALGGGALDSESTRSLLEESKDTCVVFLKAPFEILIDRCVNQPQAAIRPLLSEPEALRVRYQARLRYYERAHIQIATDGLSPDSVVEQISEKLGSRVCSPSLTGKP